jgi:hypothetical protein
MTFVGAWPSLFRFQGTTPGRDTWVVFLTGAPWTTGAVRTTGNTRFDETFPMLATGSDQRTAGGAGLVKLVTPFRITIYSEGEYQAGVPGIATLDIEFVPEPGTALAFGVAIVGVAFLGLRRLR